MTDETDAARQIAEEAAKLLEGSLREPGVKEAVEAYEAAEAAYVLAISNLGLPTEFSATSAGPIQFAH